LKKIKGISVLSFVILLSAGTHFVYASDSEKAGNSMRAIVNGRQYDIDYVRIGENGVEFRQSAPIGKFAPVKFSLSGGSGLRPGHTYKFEKNDRAAPDLNVEWVLPGKTFPQYSYVWRNYSMTLTLGKEKGYRVPGQVHLVFQDKENKAHGSLKGRFLARTSDLVVKNGHVDITQRNQDTVLYIIQKFLAGSYPNKNIRLGASRNIWVGNGETRVKPDTPPTKVISSASATLVYQVNDGKEIPLKVDLIYTTSGWKLYRIEQPVELARKVKVDLKYDTFFALTALAENHIQKQYGKENVEKVDSRVSTMENSSPKLKRPPTASAVYVVTLKNGDKKVAKFLFVKRNNGWGIDRALRPYEIACVQFHSRNRPGWDEYYRLRNNSRKDLEDRLKKRYGKSQLYLENDACVSGEKGAQCHFLWRRLVKNKFVCEEEIAMYLPSSKGKWAFNRVLPRSQRVDVKTGKIRPRSKSDYNYCR